RAVEGDRGSAAARDPRLCGRARALDRSAPAARGSAATLARPGFARAGHHVGRAVDPCRVGAQARGERALSSRAWAMWGIPAALFFIAFFHRAAPGVIAKELMQTFGATGTLIGLLASTYFYAYAALMIPGGVLIDAYGVRRV